MWLIPSGRVGQNQSSVMVQKLIGPMRIALNNHLRSLQSLLPTGRLHGSSGKSDHHDLKSLLGRDEFQEDNSVSADTYKERVVFISGAGGSIGSEICRQVAAFQPRKIVLFEVSEPALFQVQQTLLLLNQSCDIEVIPVLGTVTDAAQVRRTLGEHNVDIILHAAAHKHVPLVESNPLAGLENNVLGTNVLATEAFKAGVERFVLISTDKAVRPASVMGASKRLAELIVQDQAQRAAASTGPKFGIVRFGNVLGSSGSVVPVFREQLRRGGPLTVTHPDVTRFFMTVQEAVHLVLRAGAMAQRAEIFVLDMGRPVKIQQVARRVIEGAGLSVRDADNPTGDLAIKYIGLRPGEKLTEELATSDALKRTGHPKILIAPEQNLSEIEVAAVVRTLRQCLASGDVDRAKASAFACVAHGADTCAAARG